MNNQFTTVISYEKTAHAEQFAGRGMFKGEAGSLLKALAFMALWALLTGLLVIEPLMSTAGASFKRDHVNLAVDSTVVASAQPGGASGQTATASAPPAPTSLAAAKPSPAAKSPPLRQPASPSSAVPSSHSPSLSGPSSTAPQLSAQAAFNGQPFQLSHAFYSVK